jgi:hypothetical protein
MKQTTFADAEYAGKRNQTRKERFPIEMDQVVPEGIGQSDRGSLLLG